MTMKMKWVREFENKKNILFCFFLRKQQLSHQRFRLRRNKIRRRESGNETARYCARRDRFARATTNETAERKKILVELIKWRKIQPSSCWKRRRQFIVWSWREFVVREHTSWVWPAKKDKTKKVFFSLIFRSAHLFWSNTQSQRVRRIFFHIPYIARVQWISKKNHLLLFRLQTSTTNYNKCDESISLMWWTYRRKNCAITE